MDSWGQLNPTSPGKKKGSNRVSQSVSDSIIVSLLFCLLQPSRCRSSGHLFVMERQGRWHHVGLSNQWQPFGGVIKKKTFVLGVIPNHHFFLPAGNSFHQELFSPCHMWVVIRLIFGYYFNEELFSFFGSVYGDDVWFRILWHRWQQFDESNVGSDNFKAFSSVITCVCCNWFCIGYVFLKRHLQVSAIFFVITRYTVYENQQKCLLICINLFSHYQKYSRQKRPNL